MALNGTDNGTETCNKIGGLGIMAMSSIHGTVIIKNEKALVNLDKAFANPRELPKAKPITEADEKAGMEAFDKWLFGRSEMR